MPATENEACQSLALIDSASDVESFAASVGTNQSSHGYVILCLRSRRLLYCKNHEGDCGQNSSIGSNPAQVAGSLISAGGGAGIAIASGLGALEASTAALLSGVTAGLSLLTLPFAYIIGHHATAVVTEQKTLCDVFLAFNQESAGIEQALLAAKISLADAITSAAKLEAICIGALDQIKKTCNAACGMEYAVHALTLANQQKNYPALVDGPLASLGTAKPLLYAGAGLLVLKFLGVFK